MLVSFCLQAYHLLIAIWLPQLQIGHPQRSLYKQEGKQRQCSSHFYEGENLTQTPPSTPTSRISLISQTMVTCPLQPGGKKQMRLPPFIKLILSHPKQNRGSVWEEKEQVSSRNATVCTTCLKQGGVILTLGQKSAVIRILSSGVRMQIPVFLLLAL